jgi:alkylation response protein AidB-like acyl-CoA dehydrogenase
MDLPGIEVRAIPNISGGHMVHEVFFTDVEVPVSCLLGEEHAGWDLVIRALANERIGMARFERSARVLDAVVGRKMERDPDYVAVEERISDPDGPRPRASLSRVATTQGMKAVAEAGRDLLGAESFLDPEADQMAVAAITTPIASGSYEMQLNNIARLCLALPRK